MMPLLLPVTFAELSRHTPSMPFYYALFAACHRFITPPRYFFIDNAATCHRQAQQWQNCSHAMPPAPLIIAAKMRSPL